MRLSIPLNALLLGSVASLSLVGCGGSGGGGGGRGAPDANAPVISNFEVIGFNTLTPYVTFDSDEAGTFAFADGDDCSSAVTSIVKGSNEVQLNEFPAEGDYTCTVTFTDTDGNSSLPYPFDFTIDLTVPEITQLTGPSSPNYGTGLFVRFKSSEDGTVELGGGCSLFSAEPVLASGTGFNEVYIATLVPGVYNCTVSVEDAAGNIGSANIPAFTVVEDTVAPVLTLVDPVPPLVDYQTEDTTPTFSIQSNEDGTIAVTGDGCTVLTSEKTKNGNSGNYTFDVTFDLPVPPVDGEDVYSCSFVVTDVSPNLNESAALVVDFTVIPDSTAPILTDASTPNGVVGIKTKFSFTSDDNGTVEVFGTDCTLDGDDTVTNDGATTITLGLLDAGTYTDCSITVTNTAELTTDLDIPDFVISEPVALNDTGITLCGNVVIGKNLSQNNLVCDLLSMPAQQDALVGRDVTDDSDTDGHEGFSFSRLDDNGDEVEVDCADYDLVENNGDANGSLSQTEVQACYAATPWSCVKDWQTGLVWEVKSDDSGLRDKDYTYTWYSDDSATNGGNAGFGDYATANLGDNPATVPTCSDPAIVGDPGVCEPGDTDYLANVETDFVLSYNDFGSNNCYDTTVPTNHDRCDTAKYVEDVNAETLCGGDNWRLPTAEELLSISANDRTAPAIDTLYFPDAWANGNYWSAETSAADSYGVWLLNSELGSINNNNSYKYYNFDCYWWGCYNDFTALPVRLVRDDVAPPPT